VVVLGSWYHGFRFSNVYQLYFLFEIAGLPIHGGSWGSPSSPRHRCPALRGPSLVSSAALVALSMATWCSRICLTRDHGSHRRARDGFWLEPEIGRRRRWPVITAAAARLRTMVELWPY
jgi:hypothetical protein